jgi:hypothetical protein
LLLVPKVPSARYSCLVVAFSEALWQPFPKIPEMPLSLSQIFRFHSELTFQLL